MSKVHVRCGEVSDGRTWTCEVAVAELGAVLSRHTVRVSTADLARFAPGDESPEELIKRSFRFLLDREPVSMILRSFDLSDIGRYFPEYERELRR